MASLAVAVLSLVLHPHVQKRAQSEIDAVIGRDRLPNFDDRAKVGDALFDTDSNGGSGRLVYVEAICREILRWVNVTPAALPHAALEDDVYNGYFIPKGTASLSIEFLSSVLIYLSTGANIVGNTW